MNQAKNLVPSDVGGKSDPFCNVEIINVRLRTHTEHKTLNPKWNRLFIIPVEDIHSVVTVTVFDDDRNGKPDFLGKMVVPIMRLHRLQGEAKWFTLRTSRLQEAASPRGSIELQAHLFYNKPRAIMKALDPKEESYLAKEEKVSIKMLQGDMAKVNKLVAKYYKVMDAISDLMAWTHPPTTLMATGIWVLLCLSFEPWMFPFAITTLFIVTLFLVAPEPDYVEEIDPMAEIEEKNAKTDEGDEKFSLMDKLNKLQEVCMTTHRTIDGVTALLERIKKLVFLRRCFCLNSYILFFN